MNKTSNQGYDLLMGLLGGDNKYIDAYDRVETADAQSAELMNDVMRALSKALDLSSGQMEALRRIRGVVANADRWDPGLIRNNVFKAAHALGMNLPSHMFASDQGLRRDLVKLAKDVPEIRHHLVRLLRETR